MDKDNELYARKWTADNQSCPRGLALASRILEDTS